MNYLDLAVSIVRCQGELLCEKLGLPEQEKEDEGRCSECDELLTDDNRFDTEFYFSGWNVRPLCSECGREMLGID